MGYQVEYILTIPERDARNWLSRFKGAVFEPAEPGELPNGEFCLSDDLSAHVDLAPGACWLRLPQIRHSWLIAENPPAVAAVEHFERMLKESLPGVSGVRLDELLRQRWEASSGSVWADWPNPVAAVRQWLLSHETDERYFRFLL